MNIQKALNFCQVYKEMSEKPLPVKVAYQLMKAHKELSDDVEFYQQKFQNIINSYGLKDEEGQLVINKDNTIAMDNQYFDKWSKELEELNNLEVATPEPCIDIEEIETIRLNLRQIEAIDFLIKQK